MIFALRVLLLQAHPDSLSRKRGGRLEFEETYSPSNAGRPPKSRVAQLKGWGPKLAVFSKSVARHGSISRVGSTGDRTMSYPGPGPIYRRCIMCGRPFRVWKCELLRNRAKFCTVQCYSASRRAFSRALADGRLEAILASERAIAKAGSSKAAWKE